MEVIEIQETDVETRNKLNNCVSIAINISSKELIFSFMESGASLEDVKNTQRNLISQACQNAIYAGLKSTTHKGQG